MKLRALILAACAALPLAPAARAQDVYPKREPLTIITPYAPGAGSDILARRLGEVLREQLGQQVVVVNMPGSGGIIAARAVAQANPDGYKLLFHHVGLATSLALYKDPQFDPVKSFEPIGLFADAPMVLASGNHVPATTMPQLLEWIKRNGDKVTIASSGAGSATHLCALLIEKAAGTQLTVVQYRGAIPAMLDVMGGRVDLFCDVTAGTIVQNIIGKQLRPFFITSQNRLASIPDTPTAAEVGLPSVNVTAWYGLYAPANTPRRIVDRLAQAVQVATRDKAVATSLLKMETTLVDPSLASPAALKERISSQTQFWTSALRDAGVVPQ
jgi:tripartite-type tricarboxylate transporter receptor subunit TctC